MPRTALLAVTFLLVSPVFGQEVRIKDLTHYSQVFGEERNYRIFLPPDYDSAAGKRYPVVYFFHGWGQRFNHTGSEGGNYDSGSDYGGDTIAAFVARNDVIVVRWDGYNPRSPGEKYVRPYNIGPVETYRQFPLYFPELVEYIDATYRTIADREHRATSGLSMGGFMSFWVSGKYPHLVGSSSNFMGSSEFFTGPDGFSTEYRHTEMHPNYEGLRTRIITGSRDFIRWYHRRMNNVWQFVRPHHETEDFDSEHGTPGMGKTLAFHMKAFADPLAPPAVWHHIDVYPSFDVWGYSVSSGRRRPGFTILENVSASGFRSSVREWTPDGPLQRNVTLRIATAPEYEPGKRYHATVLETGTGEVTRAVRQADSAGRLHFTLNGGQHEVGISGEGKALPRFTGWSLPDSPWLTAGRRTRVRLGFANTGPAASRKLRVPVTTANPGVEISPARLELSRLEPGGRATAEVELRINDPHRAAVRLDLALDGPGIPVVIPVHSAAAEIEQYTVLDGAPRKVWHEAVEKQEKTIGHGNGDGAANPGETIAIGIPDSDALRGVELFTNDPCVVSSQRLRDYWGKYDHVGATAKTSLLLLSASCPEGHTIPLFVRYQLPDKPEHILKEAVIHLPVVGADTTPPRPAWARLEPWNRLETRLLDGSPVETAVASFKNGDSVIELTLNDGGRDGDQVPGDGVFAGLVPRPAPGAYSLSITASDSAGNASTIPVPGAFRFPAVEPGPPVN